MFTSVLAGILSAAMLAGTTVGCTSEQVSQLAASTPASGTAISAQSGVYSAEDKDAAWDAATATTIQLQDTSAAVSGAGAAASGGNITISAAGTYVISGTLSAGQIIVNAGKQDLVRIVLNGASITCPSSAPIWVQQADKVVLILEGGTENTVTDTANYVFADGADEPNAAIFSKADLAIAGSGALSVSANYKHGIVSKDDLIITGGQMHISSVSDGLRGKDSVSISGGAFVIDAGSDGIQSNNAADETKGWIVLDGGTYTITAANDGVQAETSLTVNGGTFTITTGDGAASVTHTASSMGGGMGGARPDREASGQMTADGQRPTGTPPTGITSGGTPPTEAPQQPAVTDNAAVDTTANTAADTTSDSYKALKSGTALHVTGGEFTIDAQDDALHTNGDAVIAGGTLTIDTGDDGIHADGTLTVEAGKIQMSSCYEGLEGAVINYAGGDTNLTAFDDGVNAAGGSDAAAAGGAFGADSFAERDSYSINISGGLLVVDAGGDGLDSNGSLTISGGTTLVNGPTSGGDSALDYDGECTVTGGTLVAAGTAGMAQVPGSTSTQAVLSVTYTQQQTAGTLAALTSADGKVIAAFKPAKAYQNIIISAPDMKTGTAYTLQSGGSASAQAVGGLWMGGTVTGASERTTVTLGSIITSIADDGSAVTSGAGGRGGMGGGKRSAAPAAVDAAA